MAPVNTKQARAIAEAEADRLADWFEQQAQPEDFRPRRSGRPPLGANYPSPRIQLRVSRPVYNRLLELATSEQTTVSKLVRRLLEQSLGTTSPRTSIAKRAAAARAAVRRARST